MSNSIKITVCVPTYNRYKDLEKLIKSYLLQTYKLSDLLILDDRGSIKTESLVKKYQKIDKRIIYHKNKKNLGFTENLRQSFTLAKNPYILFMGDDDLFIDNQALNYFIEAFSNKKVGIVKGRQILFRNDEVNQAFPINKKESITFYSKSTNDFIFEWFETLSIAGLAFINNADTKKLISHDSTLYPQVELAGKLCLNYEFASINRHLVGVKSHEGQLNCMIYDLNGYKTNILDDWLDIYNRIDKLSYSQNKKFISKKTFLKLFTRFITIFFPYTTLTQNRKDTIDIALKIYNYCPSTIISFQFLSSFNVSLLLPKKILRSFIEYVKKHRLNQTLNTDEIAKLNKILFTYYK